MSSVEFFCFKVLKLFTKMAYIRAIVVAAGRRRTSETVTLFVLKLTKYCFNTFKIKLLDSVLK